MLNRLLLTAEMGTEAALSRSVVIGWVLFCLEMEGKQIDSIQLEIAVRFSLSALLMSCLILIVSHSVCLEN